MRRHGKNKVGSVTNPAYRCTILLSVFYAVGILLGCFTARYVSQQAATQLRDYVDAYMRMQVSPPDGEAILRAAIVYFRYFFLLFLFSFSATGVYGILLACAAQGFSLAFSVSLFTRCVAGSILMPLSLFAVRCLFVLPTTLYCGCAATLATGRGKDMAFWRCFGICACALFLGTVLEITVVPGIFASAYPF